MSATQVLHKDDLFFYIKNMAYLANASCITYMIFTVFMLKMDFSLTEYNHVVTWINLPPPATPKVVGMAIAI